MIGITVISLSGQLPRSHPWIIEAYANWERRRYLSPGGILENIDLTRIAGECLVCSSVGELPSILAKGHIDLILLTPEADQANLEDLDIPVWRLRFGSSHHQQALPGLWEVVDRSLSSVSLVESARSPQAHQVLETIVGRTDPRSWIRNQLALMAKASDLLKRWIPPTSFRAQKLRRDGAAAVRLTNGVLRQQSSLAVLRLLGRFVKHARTSALKVQQWQLALDTSRDVFHLDDPQVLRPPDDRFWCDPFLFQRGDSLHVFVEEYLYKTGKGHIAMLSRSSSGVWTGPITILELPYHLSYPAVFEYEGELLMLPETTAAGRIELYRCVRFPDQWELDTVLVDNFAGADATLWFQDERWWLFVDVRDELHVCYADSPRGPWQPHGGNPVKSDARSSRPAGRIFRLGQDTIRPAQDCSLQYGHEVVFNKITRLSTCEFEEVEIGRLRTPWSDNTACHTFNQLDGFTIVDLLVTRSKR
jgi:hypothetical protein